MYQRDIDASVDWSINILPAMYTTGNYLDSEGRKRVPDAAGNFIGECISYIKREFAHRTGEPAPATGTGYADGWLKLPGVLKKYFTVEGWDPNKTYPKGSYIFNTPSHHVALYLGRSGNAALVSEQNADPDGSGVHVTTRSRFDMIMVPHVDAVPPAAPTPAPPAAVVHPYTIEEVDPRQVVPKIGAKKYGLNYDNITAINKNFRSIIVGEKVITVRAILHHALGLDYNLEDPADATGYLTSDCTNYVAPQKQTPPAAPVPIPTSTEPYVVVTTLLGYGTSNNAVNRKNALSSVSPGKYFIFNRRYDEWDKTKLIALNVTKKAGAPGAWINPADNTDKKPEPVVEPAPVQEAPTVPDVPAVNPYPNQWKGTNQPLLPNFAPVRVVTNNESPVTIHDLDASEPGRGDIILPPIKELHIVSVFQKDGVTYGRPAAAAKQFRWYGVPWELFSEEKRGLSFGNAVGQILYLWGNLIQDIKKYRR